MTKIQWTEETWNPVVGCSRVSEGCRHCYAERQAYRCAAMGWSRYEGLTHKVGGEIRWTGQMRLVPEALERPLRWSKPRRVFVNSMSDLFHDRLTDNEVASVFVIMALSHQHTFQILTKRPERMREFMSDTYRPGLLNDVRLTRWSGTGEFAEEIGAWPLPNVWLGVSVEDQRTADERIPLLLQTPAAVRFVSYEPALGPVDFERGEWLNDDAVTHEHLCGLDWVIVGGESGAGARPCDVAWIRSVVRQCRESGVACFVKQLGARAVDDKLRDIVCNGKVHYTRPPGDTACHEASVRPGYSVVPHDLGRLLKHPKGGDPAEWPADIRVREYPRPASA